MRGVWRSFEGQIHLSSYICRHECHFENQSHNRQLLTCICKFQGRLMLPEIHFVVLPSNNLVTCTWPKTTYLYSNKYEQTLKIWNYLNLWTWNSKYELANFETKILEFTTCDHLDLSRHLRNHCNQLNLSPLQTLNIRKHSNQT